MKKGKILSISSALCLGTTLFATVSCSKNKTTTSTNQNTTILKQEIDLSKNYSNKFAINQGEYAITEEMVLNILNENRNVLFSNLPSNSKLSIEKIMFLPSKGEIELDVISDKYQDEQGKIVSSSKSFNSIKLKGFNKKGISTYINYDNSLNKGIDLSQTLSEIKNQKPSEWVSANSEKNKQDILDAIKTKIKDIAWGKNNSILTLENVLIDNIQPNDNNSSISVEVEFKSSVWWENAIQKEFKTTIIFFGFKSIDQDVEIRNTIVNPNEEVIKKNEYEDNKIIYSYFSDSFKDVEIKKDDNLQNNKNNLLQFIKNKKMFIHNYEDSNIEITEENSSSNNENIKNGFIDFKIIFKNTQNNQNQKEFNLRFQGFKIENLKLAIKSSKWYRKNEIATKPGQKVEFFYGINVVLNGDFSTIDENFVKQIENNIFGSLKYRKGSDSELKEAKLSIYVLEKIDENTLSLFFTNETWNSKNYPNGGQIFEDTELSLSIIGYEPIKTTVISGIDEFEVENVSAHVSSFAGKTYRVFKFDFYSPHGGLPQIYSNAFSKDYLIEFEIDNDNKDKIQGNSYIYSWYSGNRATIYVLNEEKWNSEEEFNKYKNGTKISINISGFKIKEIYFKDTNTNLFKIKSAKWN